MSSVYNSIHQLYTQQKKGFAVLVDPDKVDVSSCGRIAALCNDAKVDYLFFGGSLMVSNHVDECIKAIKSETNIYLLCYFQVAHIK